MVNFELSRSSRLYLRSIRCLRGRETETRVLPECTSSASRTDLGGPNRREGTRDGIRDGIQGRIRMEEGRRDVKVDAIRLERVGDPNTLNQALRLLQRDHLHRLPIMQPPRHVLVGRPPVCDVLAFR